MKTLLCVLLLAGSATAAMLPPREIGATTFEIRLRHTGKGVTELPVPAEEIPAGCTALLFKTPQVGGNTYNYYVFRNERCVEARWFWTDKNGESHAPSKTMTEYILSRYAGTWIKAEGARGSLSLDGRFYMMPFTDALLIADYKWLREPEP